MIDEYAMHGYKKGWGPWGLIGGHAADGIADDNERFDAIYHMDNNKALKLAYEKGDKETFIALLRQMLTELFGTLNVTVTE